MSCQAFEERVAQYVGGDLAAEEALMLERHLIACVDCAELARELEADRAWLSTRPPEVGDVDFAAMRRHLRQEIASQRRGWRWAPAFLAAAAILLAVGIASMRHATPRSTTASGTPALVELPATSIAVTQPKPRTRRTKHLAVPIPQTDLTLEAAIQMFEALQQPELEPEPPPAGSDSPVEMRIGTRDPEVTIILVQENNGDSR